MAKMTLELAEECVRKAKEKAAEMKLAMFISVVDEMGKLVAFARMGETGIGFHSKDLAFELYTYSIPEPASMMLLGIGMFAACAVRRRRG